MTEGGSPLRAEPTDLPGRSAAVLVLVVARAADAGDLTGDGPAGLGELAIRSSGPEWRRDRAACRALSPFGSITRKRGHRRRDRLGLWDTWLNSRGWAMAAETVTVLFTDLVGSTALLSQVGEEVAEELRREHFGLVRRAIQPSSGREVKNLGDGLMVVFASAADGVAAAVEIQQAFEERNRHGDHPLLVRVGLSLGDADVEAGDYFGVPVVEAARLCALAEGGEILSTDLVRLLAGTRGGYAFEALGEGELKGMDHPVAACRVGWTPNRPSEGRPPLPVRLASSVSTSFVGRDLEHEKLTAVWKAVTAGEHRLVLVAGEPGIGKTTLAAQFATEVYDNAGLVIYGRCDEDLGIPYQPWIEALTQLVGQLPESVLADHLAVSGGALARLIPDLARRLAVEVSAAGDADAERFVLFGCVADLMARASVEHPVLVVLDDLHWADRPSVQLLRHVVTSDHAMRVAVLGTFRDSDVTSGHPLADVLAAFHREKGTERIALRGLTDEDLLALLERVAGHEMTAEGVAL